MTQQNNQSNLFESNEFQLSGEDVQITYLTSDRDGKPHFTYKDAEYDLSFTGDEIRIQQPRLKGGTRHGHTRHLSEDRADLRL